MSNRIKISSKSDLHWLGSLFTFNTFYTLHVIIIDSGRQTAVVIVIPRENHCVCILFYHKTNIQWTVIKPKSFYSFCNLTQHIKFIFTCLMVYFLYVTEMHNYYSTFYKAPMWFYAEYAKAFKTFICPAKSIFSS